MKYKTQEKIKEIKEQVGKIEEKIFNVPNAITTLRIIGTPLLVHIIIADYDNWFKATAFLVFALSDALDGFLARHLNQKTNFGAKFDMLADRLFFTSAIVAIFIKLFLTNEGLLSGPHFFSFVLSREIVALPIASYMFFTKSPFIPVKWTGKVTTFMQGAAITAFLFNFNFSTYLIILTGLLGLVAGITYWQDSLSILQEKK